MIFNLFLLLINILLIFLFNKIYFFFNREKVIFFKYFKSYLIFFFIFLLIIFTKFNILSPLLLQSLVICNFCIFLFFLFSVTLKSYESPTEIIYRYIIKKKNYSKILSSLRKKKIIDLRIRDLQNQKLIILKGKNIQLTNLGLKFCKFYSNILNFFKLSNKG